MVNPEVDISLHPPQREALLTQANEVLYGGAAGGGKSHLMRCAAIFFCTQIDGLQCYLFRRLLPDLIKTHIEGPNGLRAMLHTWEKQKLVKIVEDEVRFLWNGSKIYLSHCHEEADIYKYLSVEMHLLLLDELTTFTEQMYRFLRSRVRLAGLQVPPQFEGMFPRILAGSNPGSIGHEWVKRTWVDFAEPKVIKQAPRTEGGMNRQFLPARLDDNPSLALTDPDYLMRLEGLGSPQLVKAYRDGDWNVVAGAFFPEFSEQHIITPFMIPEHWTRVRGMDWGSYYPCCVLWGAVADGESHHIPEGALVVYREWYMADEHRKGLRLSAEEVAEGILMRESHYDTERILESTTGKDTFDRRGTASPAQRMAYKGVYFRKIQEHRPNGWDRLRSRLRGEKNVPMLYIFNVCSNLIRTLPVLQHDEKKPEDTGKGEDHAPEALRYMCAARLMVSKAREKQKPLRCMNNMTFNELLEAERQAERKKIYF